MWFIIITLFHSLTKVHTEKNSNNVCKAFEDYYDNMYNNTNCYYNPDVYLTVPEIIQIHGYPVEEYTATTSDGYILTIFRIPPRVGGSKKGNDTQLSVFIQHGIGISSSSFVNIGKDSLAFILSDEGYDVWLGNFRGCSYSNKQVTLKTTDERYWNFTFHENGIYDLPTQLDLVANHTKRKILYIGYSLGTTAYFVYSSEFPEIAKDRVEVAVALAPVVFMDKVKTPLKPKTSLWRFMKNFVSNAFHQRTPSSLKARIKQCLPYPNQALKCLELLNLLTGYDIPQINPETLPVVVMQNYEAFCMKTIDHYIQLVNSDGFKKYDYGNEGNMKIYNEKQPPLYNLSLITVPTYLIRGGNDLIATKENTVKLYEVLPKQAKSYGIYVIEDSMFSHLDFISARDVKTLLYDHIVKFLYNSTHEVKKL